MVIGLKRSYLGNRGFKKVSMNLKTVRFIIGSLNQRKVLNDRNRSFF